MPKVKGKKFAYTAKGKAAAKKAGANLRTTKAKSAGDGGGKGGGGSVGF